MVKRAQVQRLQARFDARLHEHFSQIGALRAAGVREHHIAELYPAGVENYTLRLIEALAVPGHRHWRARALFDPWRLRSGDLGQFSGEVPFLLRLEGRGNQAPSRGFDLLEPLSISAAETDAFCSELMIAHPTSYSSELVAQEFAALLCLAPKLLPRLLVQPGAKLARASASGMFEIRKMPVPDYLNRIGQLLDLLG